MLVEDQIVLVKKKLELTKGILETQLGLLEPWEEKEFRALKADYEIELDQLEVLLNCSK